jgi:hypothetical protein
MDLNDQEKLDEEDKVRASQAAQCVEVLRAKFGDAWIQLQLDEQYCSSVDDVDAQEIAEMVLSSELSESERIDLFFSLLRILPVYGMLSGWCMSQDSALPSEFWNHVRIGLDETDGTAPDLVDTLTVRIVLAGKESSWQDGIRRSFGMTLCVSLGRAMRRSFRSRGISVSLM